MSAQHLSGRRARPWWGAALLGICLWVPAARALPGGLLRGIELGQPAAPAEEALRAQEAEGVRVRRLDPTAPQHYAYALLQSDLQVMLNRADASHQLLEPSSGGLLFLEAFTEAERVILGLAAGQVQAVLRRTHVAPDRAVGGQDNPHNAARLQPLVAFQAELRAAGCALRCDPPGPRSCFRSRGICPGAALYLEYHPELDEFWALYHHHSGFTLPVRSAAASTASAALRERAEEPRPKAERRQERAAAGERRGHPKKRPHPLRKKRGGRRDRV